MLKPQLNQSAETSQAVQVLGRLVGGIRRALPDNLVGIYLYGSLVAGDFDARVSDLDLAVVLNRGLDDASFHALGELHRQVVRSYPAWEDRLELAYVSLGALKTFRRQESRIAIISPGEPFHQLQAGHDWLISWYALRDHGIALRGPAIASLIDPISDSEYILAVRAHIEAYRHSVAGLRNKSALSYAILTTARGLYTVLHSQPTSKIKAAAWAAQSFPQWAPLVNQALRWRADSARGELEAEAALRAQAFIKDMLARLPASLAS